jgi:hypothetical protein
MLGRAADFTVPGMSNFDVATLIKDNLVFNQLILEFYSPDNPYKGWVHCSYSLNGNKKEVLRFNGGQYLLGLA